MTEWKNSNIATASILEREAWLSHRYMKNGRDDALRDRLREILAIGEDGAFRPVPARDHISEETSAVLAIGNSGTGKTSLIRNAVAKLPGFIRCTEETPGNYLRVQVPPEATLKSLGISLAEMTGYPGFADKARAPEVFDVLRHRIAEIGICMICIDEVHHLFRPGPGRDPASAILMLKNLMQGEGAAALLLSGVDKAAEEISKDEETKRRCIFYRLKPVQANGPEALRLRSFTVRCCEMLGIEPPDDPFFGERLLMASSGELGKALKLMKGMLRRAIQDRRHALTLADAARQFELYWPDEGHHPFSGGDWTELRRTLASTGWGR